VSLLKPSGRLYVAIVLMWVFHLDYPRPPAARPMQATEELYRQAMPWLDELFEELCSPLANDLFEYDPLGMDALDDFSRHEVTSADYDVLLVWFGVLESALIAAISQDPTSMYVPSFDAARRAMSEPLAARCASIDDARRASQAIIAESNDPLKGVIALWGVWKAALLGASRR
jgi:hypothetical protein